MLNFKKASLYFIIECIGIVLLYYFLSVSLWWISLSIASYAGLIIYGSSKIQSNFHAPAFCFASTEEKKIAITFDDGPHPQHTNNVLSALAEYNAPATFFVIGKNIKGNESLIKRIDAAGHLIGNHTYSHAPLIDFKSKLGFVSELNATADLIYDITNKRMKYFRPPYGVTTPNLAKASKALNYRIIGWSIRSLDTTNDSQETIVNRVISQIKPGSILLFHDTSDKTVQVLKQTLNFAKENGFEIVSTEVLLNIPAYE